MSNTIIPRLLSDSPPPIAPNLDEDDDDEFGDFTGNGDLSFDDSTSIPSTPKHSKNHSDYENCEEIEDELTVELPTRNIINILDHIENNVPKVLKEEDILPVIENGCEEKNELHDVETLEVHKEIPDIPQEPTEVFLGSTEISEAHLGDTEKAEIPVRVIETAEVPLKFTEIPEVPLGFTEIPEDSLGFTEIPEVPLKDTETAEIPLEFLEIHEVSIDPIKAGCETLCTTNDDDFGDFATFKSNDDDFDDYPTFKEKNDEDDEFSDFADFSSCKLVEENAFDICKNAPDAFEKATDILGVVFSKNDMEVMDFIDQDFTSDNSVFENLKDLTETNALMYRWEKSTAQKKLLKTLNIDIRNILYGPAWNTGVPIFAANLCSTPLEPIKSEPVAVIATKTEETSQILEVESITNEVPVVEFDWTSSGLTNPLEPFQSKESPSCATPNDPRDQPVDFLEVFEEITPNPTVSSDHTKVPLDFLEVFKENLSLEAPTPENPNLAKSVDPIDESETSNKKVETFQSFPKKFIEDFVETNDSITMTHDDFGDFESCPPAHHPPGITLPLRESHIATKSDVEDEFTDFHSAAPPPIPFSFQEPLKPAILQPTKPKKIEWPEPGLDDDEANRIVLGCLRTATIPEKSTNDDEWTEFVSVKSRTATPDLPLSVFNLGNVRPPKSTAPIVTANGVLHSPPARADSNKSAEDEWGDFVSSQPLQRGRCDISSISALPELDFAAVRTRGGGLRK